jgi:FkbM family methyltransferase
VPKDGVVIDVGAHMGAFTLYAALEGASRVYSYEPDPKLFSVLQRNIAANRLEQRVKAWQAAVVGSAVPTVTFYPEANAAGHVMQRRGERNGITATA